MLQKNKLTLQKKSLSFPIQPAYEHECVSLTQRESILFYYIIRSKKDKWIAGKLKINIRTVEKHVENIKRKLNIYSRQQLCDFAYEKNLMSVILAGSYLKPISNKSLL